MNNKKNPDYVPLKEQVRKCEWCGAPFVPLGHAQKWCTEKCKKAAKRAQVASLANEQGTVEKREAEKKLTAADIALKAAELGISYGEYVGKNEYACKLTKKV